MLNNEARYKLWRKYVPMLYDVVSTQALKSPTSSIEIIDTSTSNWAEQCDADTRLVVFGTYFITSEEQNSLRLASLRIPAPCSFKQEICKEDNANLKVQSISLKTVAHEDGVMVARSMPQKSTVFASRSVSGVYLYDFSSKTQSSPLKIHPVTGEGLCWSKSVPGELVLGTTEGELHVLDVDNEQLCLRSPLKKVVGYSSSVLAVDCHLSDQQQLISGGADGRVCIWDKRYQIPVLSIPDAHGKDFGVNSVAFGPADDPQKFLTGIGPGKVFGSSPSPEIPEVKLWDARKFHESVHVFSPPPGPVYRPDEGNIVYQIRWNPNNSKQFGCSSGDGSVRIWDNNQIGASQNEFDALDGPPELLFIHSGHTDAVGDFQWDIQYPQTLISVADDSILMVWRPLIEL